MKKIIILSLCSSLALPCAAQEIEVKTSEIKVSKKVKKTGSYFGGGVDHQSKNTVAIFNYGDGMFDVYQFDPHNKPLEPKTKLDIDGLVQHLNYESTDTDQQENIGQKYDGKRVILVRSSFTGRNIVIEKGRLTHEQKLVVQAKSAANPFNKSKAWTVDKLLYKKDEKEKVKMSMMPLGTLVSEGWYDPELLEKIQEASNEGLSSGDQGMFAFGKAMADQVKTGISAAKAGLNSAFMKEDGKAVVIGKVVEKVKIGNPVPWNNNRLRIATVDAATMTAEEKETYVMPFAFTPAKIKSIDNHKKMAALLVPMNAPNTVKEAKKYQMDKENRNRVMVTVINARGELTDTVEYRSSGNNGKYDIFETQDALLIPAVTDAGHKRFYSGLVNKPSHFQITKIQNGKISYNNSFAFDDMIDKAVAPAGEKLKKVKPGEITWHEHTILKNGELVFFATDKDHFYAFHVSESGDLKKLYLNPRYDSKSKIVDSQFITSKDGKTLWMTRETPEGTEDTDIDVKTSMSSSTDSYGRTTQTSTATATPRNILEIKAVVNIVGIDLNAGKAGNLKTLGGKKYLIVGDSGYLMDDEGNMILIGFDVNKRKKLFALKVSVK